jgi:hypothetical protein
MRRAFLPRLLFPQSSRPINIIILTGMILVLLFSMLTTALPAFDEPFEEDDTAFLRIDTIPSLANYFLSVSYSLVVVLGLLSAIFRLEYVGSHIGEKRLVDTHIKSSSTFQVLSCMAALAYRAAFLLPYSFLYQVRRKEGVQSALKINFIDFVK